MLNIRNINRCVCGCVVFVRVVEGFKCPICGRVYGGMFGYGNRY